ncbi:hypothetical protein [Streptomyces sp. SS8]
MGSQDASSRAGSPASARRTRTCPYEEGDGAEPSARPDREKGPKAIAGERLPVADDPVLQRRVDDTGRLIDVMKCCVDKGVPLDFR